VRSRDWKGKEAVTDRHVLFGVLPFSCDEMRSEAGRRMGWYRRDQGADWLSIGGYWSEEFEYSGIMLSISLNTSLFSSLTAAFSRRRILG
jgi:hypothetical protein